MSILVTGGTGALGFHILATVTRNGEKLYSFSDEQPQPWQKVSDVTYCTGDLLNFKDVLAVIKEVQPRAIFHLASQSSVGLSYKKPYETLSTNLLGTQNLLEAARQVVPEAKILLLSSSEVYGRATGTLLTTLHKESDLPNPLTSYATSKACMELLGNQFTNAYGMHIVMIRPFYFTGPHHSRRFLIPAIASQLVKIQKYGAEPIIYSGSLDVSRDVLDVRDVARGLIQVLQAGNPGDVYNICSGKAYTFRELTEMLVDISGADVDFRFDPSKERTLDIPLLIGDPEKIMELGWKPMITIEDCLVDLYNEMIVRLKMEKDLKMG
ncbi:MAG: GDP-mannose 4,6-dehydratase [Hallerella sp.]|jgi:GDP-4-dehydro-6-deoxy-D-mannose reductase|nr:GDP-mannose 4,6-dehydratase [Fibrobacter sp.]MDY6368996.1 GDP-mannose 4,6-dehydratase [Fibrobacter sp.]MDY6391003.1 GDP-mannose 4,6-dehydratase [Fibrobacter sp.]MEE3339497.1 GDP-mannose 4,6-dehydratase [Hallerella sp.]